MGAFGEPAIVAAAFQVEDGLVRRIARYDDLETALADAALDAARSSDATTWSGDP